MANTFLNPDILARDAALMASDEARITRLANRQYEGTFNGRVGDTLRVQIPAVDEASHIAAGGTISATDITETAATIKIDKHFAIRRTITPEQSSLDIDQFSVQVMRPMVQGIIRASEKYAYDQLVGGFSRSVDGSTANVVGTRGNEPSTHSHILAGTKEILENQGDMSNLVSILTPTAGSSFKALNVFTSRDYGETRAQGLADGALGRLSGIEFFETPYAAASMDYGDTAGTLAIDGTVAAGGTTVVIDGFTTATGDVKEGTQFTIAGHSEVYTVTANATKAGNEVSVSIYPALSAEATNDDVVTLQTEPTQNVIYNPVAFAGAFVAPPAISATSSTQSMDGFEFRVMIVDSASTGGTDILVDTFVGFKVLDPRHGVVFQG